MDGRKMRTAENTLFRAWDKAGTGDQISQGRLRRGASKIYMHSVRLKHSAGCYFFGRSVACRSLKTYVSKEMQISFCCI